MQHGASRSILHAGNIQFCTNATDDEYEKKEPEVAPCRSLGQVDAVTREAFVQRWTVGLDGRARPSFADPIASRCRCVSQTFGVGMDIFSSRPRIVGRLSMTAVDWYGTPRLGLRG